MLPEGHCEMTLHCDYVLCDTGYLSVDVMHNLVHRATSDMLARVINSCTPWV